MKLWKVLLLSVSPLFAESTATSLPPVPASRLEQALAVTQAVGAYQIHKASPPPVLRVVYFTPAGVEPQKGYKERLTRTMLDVSDFYRSEMKRNGFADKGLPLEMENGILKLHEVKGALPATSYRHESGDQTEREMRKALQSTVDFDREFVLALYGMCRKNSDGSYFFYAPYYGKADSNQKRGLCHAADCELLDSGLLTNTKERITYEEHYGHFEKSLAEFNTAYLGGIAHELGHGLGLPHDCETGEEHQACGTSLMGGGNLTYRRERWAENKRGSFLTFATCLRLAAHPLFSGGDRERFTTPAASFKDLKFSVHPGVLRVTGTVESSVPCHTVIAYCDPDDPRGDYDAIPFTAPVKDGKFEIEATGHHPGGYTLRLAALHLNGAVTGKEFHYQCDIRSLPDADELNDSLPLRELESQAISDPAGARLRITEELLAAVRSPEKKRQLSHLRTLLSESGNSPPEPATAPGGTLFLSDAAWSEATVGWGDPARNRMGGVPQITGHILLSAAGRFYDKGLYAHSPSRYVFKLDGKWKSFGTGAAIQDGDSRNAIFIVMGDGKELCRSPILTMGKVHKLATDVTSVKTLELVVEGGSKKDSHSWSIWLEPRVSGRVP